MKDETWSQYKRVQSGLDKVDLHVRVDTPLMYQFSALPLNPDSVKVEPTGTGARLLFIIALVILIYGIGVFVMSLRSAYESQLAASPIQQFSCVRKEKQLVTKMNPLAKFSGMPHFGWIQPSWEDVCVEWEAQ